MTQIDTDARHVEKIGVVTFKVSPACLRYLCLSVLQRSEICAGCATFPRPCTGRVATTDGSRGLQPTVRAQERFPSRSDGGIRPQVYPSPEHHTPDSGVADATHFISRPLPGDKSPGYRPMSLRDARDPLC